MTSKMHSQVELYGISLKICPQAVKETYDKMGIRDLLDWYFEDLIKTREDYELIKGDLMNDIRAMYIQDEKEESRKEGRIEGKKEGRKEGRIEGKESIITNIIKEINDVDYIHKITKYPRSEIIKIAESSSINIKI